MYAVFHENSATSCVSISRIILLLVLKEIVILFPRSGKQQQVHKRDADQSKTRSGCRGFLLSAGNLNHVLLHLSLETDSLDEQMRGEEGGRGSWSRNITEVTGGTNGFRTCVRGEEQGKEVAGAERRGCKDLTNS